MKKRMSCHWDFPTLQRKFTACGSVTVMRTRLSTFSSLIYFLSLYLYAFWVWSENTLVGFVVWSMFNQEASESHSHSFSLNTLWERKHWEEGRWKMLPCSTLLSSLQGRVVVPGERTPNHWALCKGSCRISPHGHQWFSLLRPNGTL